MTSNVYLALGIRDDVPVMKVGKANDVQRRQKEIKLKVSASIECADEAAAFALETKLRQMMRQSGASQYSGKDWFSLDADIFDDVLMFCETQLGQAMLADYPGTMSAADFEVAWYQAVYKKTKDVDALLEKYRAIMAEQEARIQQLEASLEKYKVQLAAEQAETELFRIYDCGEEPQNVALVHGSQLHRFAVLSREYRLWKTGQIA